MLPSLCPCACVSLFRDARDRSGGFCRRESRGISSCDQPRPFLRIENLNACLAVCDHIAGSTRINRGVCLKLPARDSARRHAHYVAALCTPRGQDAGRGRDEIAELRPRPGNERSVDRIAPRWTSRRPAFVGSNTSPRLNVPSRCNHETASGATGRAKSVQ